MRFLSALKNDMRYQAKYGFYFLYAFISAVYIAIIFFVPSEYKGTAASVIILSDPAMLGVFFIGGIWLLEKREGLHKLWRVSPLRPIEYIVSKAASLSLISTFAAVLIALIAFRGACKYILLSASVFVGSMIFTLIGLILATYARSVNQYMIIVTPPAIILVTPAVLAAIGISHPVFDMLPGTALWRMIAYALNIADRYAGWLWLVLAVWFGSAILLGAKRIPIAMLAEGGE
jgi:fluoroquinolone transport system permease protein